MRVRWTSLVILNAFWLVEILLDIFGSFVCRSALGICLRDARSMMFGLLFKMGGVGGLAVVRMWHICTIYLA